MSVAVWLSYDWESSLSVFCVFAASLLYPYFLFFISFSICASLCKCVCCVMHNLEPLFKYAWCFGVPVWHTNHLHASLIKGNSSHLRRDDRISGARSLTFSDLPRNVINFLTTAVDLLLRRKEAAGDEPSSLGTRNGKHYSISVYKSLLKETQRRAKSVKWQ